MNKVTIRKKINPCFLTKNELVVLAEIVYSRYLEEAISANKEWENKKLPLVIKKIEDHNKAVKKNKVSYFGYTSVEIDDPSKIIEKEKGYFLNTEKGFQEWRTASFKVIFKDKTIESSEPQILGEISDTDRIVSLEFISYSLDGKNKAKVNIAKNGESFYEIEGIDESWVRATKDKISEILTDNEFSKPFLHRDSFKITLTLLLDGLGLYTYFSFVNKLDLEKFISSSIVHWISILLSLVIFIWLIRIFYGAIDSIYPYLQLERKQKDRADFGIALVILVGLLTNFIYDIAKWIY